MKYSIEFEKRALKEWKKLGYPIREQFKKTLAKRLENPHIISAQLHGHPYRYKIKLKSSGYRLIYEVNNNRLLLLVIAVGVRANNEVYQLADQR